MCGGGGGAEQQQVLNPVLPSCCCLVVLQEDETRGLSSNACPMCLDVVCHRRKTERLSCFDCCVCQAWCVSMCCLCCNRWFQGQSSSQGHAAASLSSRKALMFYDTTLTPPFYPPTSPATHTGTKDDAEARRAESVLPLLPALAVA